MAAFMRSSPGCSSGWISAQRRVEAQQAKRWGCRRQPGGDDLADQFFGRRRTGQKAYGFEILLGVSFHDVVVARDGGSQRGKRLALCKVAPLQPACLSAFDHVERGQILRVVQDLPNQDTLPAAVQTRRELEAENRQPAAGCGKQIRQRGHRRVAAGRRDHSNQKEIGAVIDTKLPCADEIALRLAEVADEIAELTGGEQVGATCLLRL
ncbi:MAG: hypothetical protein E5V37_24505 [Mesorhizobium sp.]|nr:MAG: hypothetical protein E5V37_24505 [Mesorhizobium sp.]